MVRNENVKRLIRVMKKKVDPIRSRLQLLRTVYSVYMQMRSSFRIGQ